MKISAAAFVTALVATAGLADAAAVKCANGVSYRRDFRDLSQTEWDKFVGALKTLNTKPSTRFAKEEGLSKLEEFSRLHDEHFKEIHSVFEQTDDPNKPANSVFLPWHRQFILELEQELQKIDPTVTLPYWHQGIDADAPEKSFLFSAERLGGSAPLAAGEESGCVPNGPLAGLQHRKYGCVRRGFQPDGRISVELMEDMMPEPYNNKVTFKARLPTAQEIDMFVHDTKEWSKFTDNMELVYHPVAHLFVGGNKHGTMNRPFSPMDWTFFLHHSYVDYVWSRWQEVHPGSHDFGSKPLPGYGSLTGASVANREELCYQYLPPGALNPKPVPPATTTTKTTTTTSTTTTTTSAVPTTTTTTSARTTTTSAATTTTSSAVPTTTSSTAATTTTKAADKSTTSSAATTTTAASSSTKADDKKSTTATTTSAAGSTTTTAASSTTATTTSVPSSSSAATSSAWTSSAADKTSTKQGHTTTTAASGTTTASTASSTSDATTATEPAYGKRKSTTSTTSLSATKTQESTTAATESATKTEAEQSTSSTTAAATTEPVYGKRPAGDKKPEAGKPTATYDDGYPIITPAPAKPGKPARPAAPAVYVPKKPGYPVPPADFPGYILRPIPSKGRVMPLMNKAMLKNMGYSEKRVKQCQEYMRKIEKKVEAKVKAGEWVPSFGQTEETRELLGSLYTTEVQGTDNSTAAIATAHKAEKSAATKSSSWAVTGVFGAVAAIALMN